jgi:hypothetical protein
MAMLRMLTCTAHTHLARSHTAAAAESAAAEEPRRKRGGVMCRVRCCENQVGYKLDASAITANGRQHTVYNVAAW